MQDSPDRRAAYIQGAIRGTLTYMRYLAALALALLLPSLAVAQTTENLDQRASYIRGSLTRGLTYNERADSALARGDTAQAIREYKLAIGGLRGARTSTDTLRAMLRRFVPDPIIVEIPGEPLPPIIETDTLYIDRPGTGGDTIWGFSGTSGADCSVDVTSEIIDWFAEVPNGARAVFRPGCYRIDGGLTLRGRSDLTIDGAGSEFRAAYSPDRKRAHWLFTASSDITIRNMTLLGPIVETAGVSGPYVPALVAQFGIGLSGVQGAIVEDVQVRGVYADCFYAGGGSVAAGATRNVIVRRMVCEGTGRHGMAITNAENVLVEDSYIGDIRWSGIDVEPGAEGLLARNIEFRRNTFGLVRHYLLTVGGKSDWPNVGNIKFNENVQVATHPTSTEAIRLAGSEIGFRQHFEVSRNTFQPYGGIATLSRVSDVVMEDNRVSGRIGTAGYKHIELANVHDSTFRNNNQGVPVWVVFKEGTVPSTGIVEVP